MKEYLELDKIRTLFKMDNRVWKYYNTLKQSMLVPPERYTILYLCPNIKEMEKCFNTLIKYYEKDCYLSNDKSYFIAKDLRQHKNIIFYNSFKDREQVIYIFPLSKIKSGFDGYRISEIRFFGLNRCFLWLEE